MNSQLFEFPTARYLKYLISPPIDFQTTWSLLIESFTNYWLLRFKKIAQYLIEQSKSTRAVNESVYQVVEQLNNREIVQSNNLYLSIWEWLRAAPAEARAPKYQREINIPHSLRVLERETQSFYRRSFLLVIRFGLTFLPTESLFFLVLPLRVSINGINYCHCAWREWKLI